ncbi:hypothetical protein GCM10023080_075840 [Streptomyces pseudoechinosporeus]
MTEALLRAGLLLAQDVSVAVLHALRRVPHVEVGNTPPSRTCWNG